jgi:hypothetical protein
MMMKRTKEMVDSISPKALPQSLGEALLRSGVAVWALPELGLEIEMLFTPPVHAVCRLEPVDNPWVTMQHYCMIMRSWAAYVMNNELILRGEDTKGRAVYMCL